ncbi:hypothetical protein [Nocardia sp. NPDC004711]
MTDEDFRKQLGRKVVTRIAPDELPLFDVTWQALGRNPGRRSKSREEPLGLGLPEVSDLLVTAVVSGVVTAVIDDLNGGISRWTRRFFARKRNRSTNTPGNSSSPNYREELIRDSARSKAIELGMSEAKADALVDALISELETGTHEP